MKIGTKVNIILLIVFLSGIFLSGITLSHVLEKKAENEVASKASILMQMANSVRNYTNDRVQPLLLPKLATEEQFIRESIPTFSVREVFEYLRADKEYVNFMYKDAALNPTNLRDKADEFEAEIVKRFRQKPDLKDISGFRTMSGVKLFYTAHPFVIKKQTCLQCHSTPETASKTQLTTYGKNGFGWQLNQIVATQIVYVPAENVLKSANNSFMIIIGLVGIIFTVIIILINQLLRIIVLKRIGRIAAVAEQVSIGDLNANFDKQSKDEIGELAEAFNRMKYSLEIALSMLNNKSNSKK
jgi:methyl-accepting chemotaxis protein